MARALLEELRGAAGFLVLRVELDHFRTVAALGALQRIAALVVAPRLSVFTTVLVGLAERETEVIAVDEAGRRPSLCSAHGLELCVHEAVGLEVGEAPVRVPKIRTLPRRRPVLTDRIGLAPQRLQRMCARQMQF